MPQAESSALRTRDFGKHDQKVNEMANKDSARQGQPQDRLQGENDRADRIGDASGYRADARGRTDYGGYRAAHTSETYPMLAISFDAADRTNVAESDVATSKGTEDNRGRRDFKVYLLIPVASPDDPGWELSPFRGEVLVRARSTGEARATAARVEADILAHGYARFDRDFVRKASAFANGTLYGVVQTREDVPSEHSNEAKIIRWPAMGI